MPASARGRVSSSIARFERSSIERIAGYYRRLLEGMIAEPRRPVLDHRCEVALGRQQLEQLPESASPMQRAALKLEIGRALQILERGDEVIISDPHYACYPNFIKFVQGRVVTVPVYEEDGFQYRPDAIAAKITDRTRVIMTVHLSGYPTDMDPIMEVARDNGLAVLEDCAHAHGAEYKGRKAGSIGDVGCWSFHSLKNMTTCGEGGMVTTNHDEWQKPIEMLRCKRSHPCRMTVLKSCLGLVRLTTIG